MYSLNCDLGESFGSWKMGADQSLMPIIDMANIACGFHAGDPDVMQQTLSLAKMHNVQVGAHPGYADLQGFGRRSIPHSDQQICNLVMYQVSALIGMAQGIDIQVRYVKPHGALYNDMMKDADVRFAVYRALQLINKGVSAPLKLMMLATPDNSIFKQEASTFGLELIFEGFIDRRYMADGKLTPRTEMGAVLTPSQMLEQVKQLVTDKSVTTECGHTLSIECDTLCVHGDSEIDFDLIRTIKTLCQG